MEIERFPIPGKIKSEPIKRLVSVLSGIALGISLSGNAMAYEIGDKMPDFKNKYFFVGEIPWNIDGKTGVRWGYTADEDDFPEFVVFHRKCGEDIMEKPFAFHEYGKYILHIDKNLDGRIDRKSIFPEGYPLIFMAIIAPDIPDC